MWRNDIMDNLIREIDSGKARGYCESRPCNSKSYFFQYAIRKKNNQYLAYFFSIDESKMEVFEDYANEEEMQFKDLNEAFNYLEKKGADIKKFAAFKGVSPL